MQKVSNEYKASMKSSLRERSYMMISFGLVNQEAQANATVIGNNFAYYSKQTGYLRVGAGTGKTAITLMPAGSSVQCYGYYTTYNGTRWYYVVYGDKTGFCSSAYLQKA